MDLTVLTTSTVLTFLLMLFRAGGMFFAAPLLNNPTVPAQVKIGFAVAITLILFPFYSKGLVVPTDVIAFSVMAIQEIIIGLLVGFTISLLFVSLQMAGEFISFQMGLSISNVLDPITGTQVPTLGQIYYYFALLLFLALNAHHVLIAGINFSFVQVPLGTFFEDGGIIVKRFIELGGGLFSTAVVLVAPVMGILLVTEVALGFMAKVMPQMNIFMVAMPLKVAIGLTVMSVSVPYVSEMLAGRYDDMFSLLKVILKT